MRPFEYLEPGSLDEAVALLSHPGHGSRPEHGSRPIAGGTDLLSEMKEGVLSPARLVGLSHVPGLAGVEVTEDGLTIGAMTTIAEIAAHPIIGSRYGALTQAAATLATPHIRNVGTLGGNLCQRPRCWYYRHPLIPCLKKGGDRCYALAGASKYLCILGGDRCYIVHPSDTAVALVALGASVEVHGPGGARRMPVEELFAGPSVDVTRENVLGDGELVTRVHVPEPPEGARSIYLKAREREAGDFALASVAAAMRPLGSIVAAARVVLGGVAPVPYRAHRTEEYLEGRSMTEVDGAVAGRLAVEGATPMKDNAYKVPLAANLVKRAVARLLAA